MELNSSPSQLLTWTPLPKPWNAWNERTARRRVKGGPPARRGRKRRGVGINYLAAPFVPVPTEDRASESEPDSFASCDIAVCLSPSLSLCVSLSLSISPSLSPVPSGCDGAAAAHISQSLPLKFEGSEINLVKLNCITCKSVNCRVTKCSLVTRGKNLPYVHCIYYLPVYLIYTCICSLQ